MCILTCSTLNDDPHLLREGRWFTSPGKSILLLWPRCEHSARIIKPRMDGHLYDTGQATATPHRVMMMMSNMIAAGDVVPGPSHQGSYQASSTMDWLATRWCFLQERRLALCSTAQVHDSPGGVNDAQSPVSRLKELRSLNGPVHDHHNIRHGNGATSQQEGTAEGEETEGRHDTRRSSTKPD